MYVYTGIFNSFQTFFFNTPKLPAGRNPTSKLGRLLWGWIVPIEALYFPISRRQKSDLQYVMESDFPNVIFMEVCRTNK